MQCSQLWGLTWGKRRRVCVFHQPFRRVVGPLKAHARSAGEAQRGVCGLRGGSAPDSHPFFPSRAASGQCFLTAAAAGVPCGVVSALAGPSRWRTGGVLVVVGVVLRPLLSTPLHVQVVHHMPRRVSVCVGPNHPTPPRGHLHGFRGCHAHLHGWRMLVCG